MNPSTTRVLAALFLGAGVNIGAAADTFLLNTREVLVPAPKGFVRVTDEMSGVTGLVESMVDPANDMLAYYIRESDVPAALAGELPMLERTFALKAIKQLRNVSVSKGRFLGIKLDVKRQNQKTFDELKSKMPRLMNKASQLLGQEFDVNAAIEISSVVPLEMHYEAEDAFSFSVFLKYDVAVDAYNESSIVSSTVTLLNSSGAVLSFASFGSKDDLEWTRDACLNWARSVEESNIPPPEEPPKEGSSAPPSVVERGSNGVVVACFLALVAGAVFLVTRKRG